MKLLFGSTDTIRTRTLKQISRSLSTAFGSGSNEEFSPYVKEMDSVTTSYNLNGSFRDRFICERKSQKRTASAPTRTPEEYELKYRLGEDDIEPHRGRPLHEILHTESRKSLFSSGTEQLDLKGFVNLVIVILVVINFRMVIYNFRKYGLLLELPTGFAQMFDDWPLFRGSVKVHISLVFAWAIERFIAPLSSSPLTLPVLLLQGLNLSIVIFYPYLTVVHYKTEPALSALTLATSVVWALKIYSFHHVCFDYRRAVCNGDEIFKVCKTKMEAKAASNYPDCIQLLEFYRFIIMPTVCFQFYYPMNPRIQWMHVLRYFAQFVFLLAVARILADQYIVVTVSRTFTMKEFKSANFSTVAYHIIDRMLLLSIPILYCWIIMFAVIFHHWCNLLAEITRFGDRRFYGDWWNAACFGEYWRKWNLPIHQFIIRHISKPLYSIGIPWDVINIIVFTISAALHEYLISVPLGLGWTGYVFWAMMGQIPLLIFTRMEWIRKKRTLGNVLFWCLFCFTGQPLGVLLYWYLWGVKQGSFA